MAKGRLCLLSVLAFETNGAGGRKISVVCLLSAVLEPEGREKWAWKGGGWGWGRKVNIGYVCCRYSFGACW